MYIRSSWSTRNTAPARLMSRQRTDASIDGGWQPEHPPTRNHCCAIDPPPWSSRSASVYNRSGPSWASSVQSASPFNAFSSWLRLSASAPVHRPAVRRRPNCCSRFLRTRYYIIRAIWQHAADNLTVDGEWNETGASILCSLETSEQVLTVTLPFFLPHSPSVIFPFPCLLFRSFSSKASRENSRRFLDIPRGPEKKRISW